MHRIARQKQFPELFVITVALNQVVLFTTLQHLYVLPLVTYRIGLGEFRFAYETYHTRILFFERYARTLTYSILASSSHYVDLGPVWPTITRYIYDPLVTCVRCLLTSGQL